MSRLPIVAGALALAACGGAAPDDNAVEATERNTVEVAGVDYRVVLFRQLNVHTPPDDALWEGAPSAAGRGLYAVVLRACARGGGPAATSGRIHFEDAFGQRFAPRPADTADDFEYMAATLDAGECRPEAGSAADRTFDGAVMIFDVPFDSTAERPLILEIDAPKGERGEARIQLDL